MKRWFGVLVVACATSLAVAQAPFTIVRPADGSKVREKVHILIPKSSIPPGGYIGLFLNGKFMEATVPPVSGKYYDYVLDTKGKQIPDGPATLEAVLYVDFKDNPRIVDRSSVSVTVGNKANIPIPEGGIRLRYKYVPGTEATYTLQQTVTLATLSSTQNQLGGHPSEEERANEKIRIMYAVDNAYGNGDGLIRMQPMPLKGKESAFLTTAEDPNGGEYFMNQMQPIYMRLNSTGRQIFGAVPPFFASEAGGGPVGGVNLFAPYPLPVLPTKPVKPGSVWLTSFQLPSLDLSREYETNSIVHAWPARGEFVGVEWEMGHPCAKIRHTVAAGTHSVEGAQLAAMGRSFADQKVEVDETIWFALDRRQVLKVIRNQTVEEKADAGVGAGMGGSMGGGAPSGGSRGARGPTGVGGPTGSGGDMVHNGSLLQRGPTMPGGRGMGRPGGGVPGGQGGPGRSGGGAPTSQFIRIRFQQVFTLEQ